MERSGWLLILVVIAAAGIGGFAWYRFEGESPGLEAPDAELVIGKHGMKLELRATDTRSGLRSLRVAVAQPSGEQVLLEEAYPGNLLSGGTRSEQSTAVQLDPANLGSLKGPATLSISVRDWSWRGAFAGNETRRDLPLRVDLEPPRIEVTSGISGITYVRQGGSGSVAYRVSEPTARDGVRVGSFEYRGFPRKGGRANDRIALFAVPTEVDAKSPVRVFAEDAAGNTSEAGWAVVVQPYLQPVGKVQLTQTFLEQVVPRLAPQSGAASPDAAFQDVNTRVRAENEKKIRELVANTAPELLFTGNLHQLANSKVTSRFGEKRIYMVDGREISRAVHFGYDLASLSGAPVTATAAGRVLYAGDLGIYGNCVVLDHGLGLTSIYGHLSRIDVEANARVEGDQRLGLTGSTGLAGGDHLHFATLVGNTYVDPIEWWDAKWVADHVTPNLNPQPIAQ
ncbi:MAG TPA: M23 family metallopeptidase [Myxococcota bacterium]|nr:M23 family metallopeptidase [Myxococcota bacterium]